MLFLASD